METSAAAVIIAGDDGVPVRVREELESAGVATVCVCSGAATMAARSAQAAGTRVVVGDPGSAATWEEAGLEHARSVGLLSAHDLPNLNAALLVAELRADVPIVVRLFSADLSDGIARLLGGRATVLSDTEVAAPAFLQAALSGNTGQKVTIAGHVLEVAEVDPDHPGLVVALANADTPTEVLPSRAEFGPLVLGLVDTAGVVLGARGALPPSIAQRQLERAERAAAARGGRKKSRLSRRKRLAAAIRAIPPRAVGLFGAIALVMATATTVFASTDHLDVLDAFYFTATTMATVGYGDINLSHAPHWLKLFDIGLMGVSAVLLAAVLAFVTDLLVSQRIDRALGRFPRPRRDHVIVCGLGKVGARIIAGLHELEVPCIGVEQSDDAVGVAVARALEIPVVFGDARATLEELNVREARAVMAVTTDDLANLQVGLTARELRPEARVVLRMFDPRLAERLDRSIELDLTRSVSALAAPAFTAALLGRPLAQPLSLSNVPLRVLEVEVPEGSRVAGRLIRDVHHEGELRVLALEGRWRPRDDQPLLPGLTVSVVGTRDACDDLLAPRGVLA